MLIHKATWEVIGLVKSVAREVAHGGIAVNAVCPDHFDTIMIHNEPSCMIHNEPSQPAVIGAFTHSHQIPVPWVPPGAVRYIVAPSSKYITGSTRGVACDNTALMP